MTHICQNSMRVSLVVFVCCMSTLQFGFHLSAFNAPQGVLACNKASKTTEHMSSFTFKSVTCISTGPDSLTSINSLYTLGGFLSSAVVGWERVHKMASHYTIQKLSALFFFIGSILIVISNSMVVLGAGRLITGFASGACMVVAPIIVSEVSHIESRGCLGSLLQLGVPSGILFAQILAILWSNSSQWRLIFICGAFIGLAQLTFLCFKVPHCLWFDRDVKSEEVPLNPRQVYADSGEEINVNRVSAMHQHASQNTHLLSPNENYEISSDLRPAPSIRSSISEIEVPSLEGYCVGSKYRKEFLAVAIIMSAQQLCGMNAITFYGVQIMSNLVPKDFNVLFLTSLLAFVNLFSMILVSPFIDRWGRKPFLICSSFIMAFFALMISIFSEMKHECLAALSCFGFVFGYSVGLAQIPFLMVAEISSSEVVAIAQSTGTSINWLANVCVVLFFPSLQKAIGGFSFSVLSTLGFFFMGCIYKYVPETSKRSRTSS